MSEIEKIKRRITKRKSKINLESEARGLNDKKSSPLFKCLMAFMTVYALFVSFAIYVKKDENATFMNSVFNTNINFSKFNNVMASLINFRVIDNNGENLDSIVVSSDINYVSIGDDYYTSDSNIVTSLDDGIVTYVNGKDEFYTIIVEYDCGIRATYTEVIEPNVYVNDRIYQDDIIGSYNEKVKIIFIKDKNKLSYEEVVEFI